MVLIYLLKLINKEEFCNAISMSKNSNVGIKTSLKQLHQALAEVMQEYKKYKTTFLVKQDESLIPIETIFFAHFNIKSNVVKGITFDKKSFIIDEKMEAIEAELDPALFYRANRQFIVQRKAIVRINYAFNGKLTITTTPKLSEPIVISKAKSTHFKEWMRRY